MMDEIRIVVVVLSAFWLGIFSASMYWIKRIDDGDNATDRPK